MFDKEIKDEKSIAEEEDKIKEKIRELKEKMHTGKQCRIKKNFMKYFFVSLIYLIIALIIFVPLTSHITTVAPGVGGDTYQNLWDIWWVGYATFTLHSSIWYTYLLYPPIGASLIFQTMAPISSLISVPFQLINLIFAYNVLFFAGFMVSGLGMFALAEYLVKNSYASFIAGAIFTFSAFHIAQSLSHIDWMFIGFVPLSVYFFLKIINGEQKLSLRSIVYPIALGLSFMLAVFMGDIEQGIMLILIFIAIFIFFILQKRERTKVLSKTFLLGMGIFVLVAFVSGSFGFIPILSGLNQSSLSFINQASTPANIMTWSDNLLSFFLPSSYNGLAHSLSSSYSYIFSGNFTETTSYVGYTVIILAIYGIYKERRRSILWISIALVFGWMALGPYIQVGNLGQINSTCLSSNAAMQACLGNDIPGIYYFYSKIPLFNVFREPGRFDLAVEMAIAVIAAFGMNSVLEKFKSNSKKILAVAAIGAIILIESNGIMSGSVAAIVTTKIITPQYYYAIGNYSLNFTTLNLPALSNPTSSHPALYPGEATYYTAITHKPLVGGYLTRQNNTQEEYLFNIPLVVQAYNLQLSGSMIYQSPINENFTNQTLFTLYNYNTAFVTIEENAFNESDFAQLFNYTTGVFGQPILSNFTLFYPTTQAINRSVFRSYVAYPILTDWSPQQVFINGSNEVLWVPLNLGMVLLYAPYANTTNMRQKIITGESSPINTTITFQAETYAQSNGYYPPTKLGLYTINRQGRETPIATFNTTNKLEDYTLNTTFVSGPNPNVLLFSTNSNSTYVLIRNITFTKRK